MRRTRLLARLATWIDGAGKGGLPFSCTQCGRCCKGRTNVFVNEAEVEKISSHLNIEKDDFIYDYTETKESPDGLVVSLKTISKSASSKQCIFLDNGKCTVYDVRPTQCRTYPFWPQILLGRAEWEAEAARCEVWTCS